MQPITTRHPTVATPGPEYGRHPGPPSAAARLAVTLQPFAGSAFAAAMIWLGAVHLIFGEDLQRLIPLWPDWVPGRPLWAHAAGVVIVAGGLLMLGRRATTGALGIGAVVLLAVLCSHLPRALPSGTFGDAWLNVLKWLSMATAPIVAAAAIRAPRPSWQIVVLRAAPWLLAAFMIGSAVQHVLYAEFVMLLMQPWMPARLFWTYFAAAALAAGGIGLIVPRTRVLAALLTGAMIGSWFFLVHTPRMLVEPTGPVGWSEMAESLAFAALAVLLAAHAARDLERSADKQSAEAT